MRLKDFSVLFAILLGVECTMGDVPRILSGTVTKVILARSWVSWVSRDQKFTAEYKYIGFLFDLPLIFV